MAGRCWVTLWVIAFVAVLAQAPLSAEAASPLPDKCKNPPVSFSHETRPIKRDRWSMDMEIAHHKGMVFRNITAAGNDFLRSFHLAYLEVAFKGVERDPAIVRFCSGDDAAGPVDYDPNTGTLRWHYDRRFDEPGLHGNLRVTYRTRIKVRPEGCAGRNNSRAFTRSCIRFVPVIDYDWLPDLTSPGESSYEIASVTAHIRLAYGDVAVGLVSDGDWFFSAPQSTGIVPILEKETRFEAVRKGQKGKWDNIHTAVPVDGRRTITVPGCRSYGYDCTHLHWRWGGSWAPPLDPLTEPFTGKRIADATEGTAYLLGKQDLVIAVVADKGEGDVLDPLSLADGDRIAVAEQCPDHKLDSGGIRWSAGEPTLPPSAYIKGSLVSVERPVVVWYVARSTEQSDSFFRTGFFALEPLRSYADQRSSFGWAIDQFFESLRVKCDPGLSLKPKLVRKAMP